MFSRVKKKKTDLAHRPWRLMSRGRTSVVVTPSSAPVDGVVRRVRLRTQGLAGPFVSGEGGRRGVGARDGLPVLLQHGVLAAGQLQEGGQAVQVGHLVEGAQQEIHHHQTHEQVDCRWRDGSQRKHRVQFLTSLQLIQNAAAKTSTESWI